MTPKMKARRRPKRSRPRRQLAELGLELRNLNVVASDCGLEPPLPLVDSRALVGKPRDRLHVLERRLERRVRGPERERPLLLCQLGMLDLELRDPLRDRCPLRLEPAELRGLERDPGLEHPHVGLGALARDPVDDGRVRGALPVEIVAPLGEHLELHAQVLALAGVGALPRRAHRLLDRRQPLLERAHPRARCALVTNARTHRAPLRLGGGPLLELGLERLGAPHLGAQLPL
jgi:hypothetical protein